MMGPGSMGAPLPPNMGDMMGGMGMPAPPPPSENEMILQGIQAVLEKWGSGEAQIAGEKNALLQTLMMLAGVAPPSPMDAMVEGTGADQMLPADPMGMPPGPPMGPPPMDPGMPPMADPSAGGLPY